MTDSKLALIGLGKSFEDYLAEDAARERQRQSELNSVVDAVNSSNERAQRPTSTRPSTPARPKRPVRDEAPPPAQEDETTLEQAKA